MDAATFDCVKNIQEHLNTRSRKDNGFGKACQLLLAITFCRLGFQVQNHCSEGVDIDIWDHYQFPHFSIEVKTTIKNTVQLGKKDVEEWEKKAREGYETAFAVLRIELLSEWLIAKAKGIPAGNIPLGRLQVRAIPELQNEVNLEFPLVVAKYGTEILKRQTEDALTYLDKCLEKEKQTAVPRKNEVSAEVQPIFSLKEAW